MGSLSAIDLSAVTEAAGALHFLRPAWLWALLGLPLLAWWWRARRRRSSAWRDTVDAHLLPHLLDGRSGRRGRWAIGVAALAYLLAVLALAGPSWRQTEQPLWQSRTPLVIALDLSSATLAGDLPPSRLAQARAKLETLLGRRDDGQVGLVAYAADAYTVSPLTGDAANVALFLDALHPDIMPVDGQRSDRAIEWSARLLRQAGFDRGRILLMTDHADARAIDAAADARAAGYSVSVLGLGTAAGAPYRRRNGEIAQAQLDAASLKRLATAGGGRYATLQTDAGDLRALGVLDAGTIDGATAGGETGRVWQDGGYWLLLPLMLLALFAFRRRSGALAVLLLCAWLPWQPARAVEWWQRPEQIAHETLQQGTQAYRQENFERAAQLYGRVETANGNYNLGNALAKAGQYRQAIDAYQRALELRPGMADALANKRAVEQAMKRKAPSGGGKQPQPQSKSDPKPCQPGDDNCYGPSSDGAERPTPSNERSNSKSSEPKNGQAPPPAKPDTVPSDKRSQAQADQAQRERMKRALEQAESQPEQQGQAKVKPNETAAQRERRLANQAWLNRVPDDPGGLLREKFRLEYQRRQMQGGPGE